MLFDDLLTLSVAQPLPTLGEALSQNTVQVSALGITPGVRTELHAWFMVAAALSAASGTPTVRIALVESSDAGGANASVIYESGEIAASAMTAGAEFVLPAQRPPGSRLPYLMARYAVSNGALAAGALHGRLVQGHGDQVHYPKAFTV